jgi:hypothetical protein
MIMLISQLINCYVMPTWQAAETRSNSAAVPLPAGLAKPLQITDIQRVFRPMGDLRRANAVFSLL